MSHAPLRILIADDDQEDLELLGEALRNTGSQLELTTVLNGSAALQVLRSAEDDNLPALIVLDYSMPLMSGLDVLKVICNDSRYERIPVVILSTSNSPAHIEECKNHGALEYFVKPKSIPELDLIAQKLIGLSI